MKQLFVRPSRISHRDSAAKYDQEWEVEMKDYEFYGWEDALVKPVNEKYQKITSPRGPSGMAACLPIS